MALRYRITGKTADPDGRVVVAFDLYEGTSGEVYVSNAVDARPPESLADVRAKIRQRARDWRDGRQAAQSIADAIPTETGSV